MIKDYFKRIKKFTTFGLSNFVATAIYSIFWMYLATTAEKTEYGEIGFLMSIATVAFAFSALGLDRIIIVYGAKNENIFSPTYLLGLISSLVTVIVTYIIIQNIFVSLFIFGIMIFYLFQANLTSENPTSSAPRARSSSCAALVRDGCRRPSSPRPAASACRSPSAGTGSQPRRLQRRARGRCMSFGGRVRKFKTTYPYSLQIPVSCSMV